MHDRAMPRRVYGEQGEARESLQALAVANARYWPSVAPVVRRELALWREPAQLIDDTSLRELAVGKLRDEYFNAEVAATLATLAPRRMRATAVRAIVALELLFDYLDGRTELPMQNRIDEGLRLFGAFVSAVEPDSHSHGQSDGTGALPARNADGGYMRALAAATRESLFALPAAEPVAQTARVGLARCAQAQTRLHACATLGSGQLQGWAEEASQASGLGWREFTGGSASGVLGVHALIAAAADPATSTADARRIDAVYLAIGGVITMLDSLVDHGADTARGEAGFIDLYNTGDELERSMHALVHEALARAREAPHSAHHAMTLAGAVAYYTTHPGAYETHARTIATMLRRELSPTIWPGLGVLIGWRAAKRVRTRLGSLTRVDSKRAGDQTNASVGGASGTQAA